MDWENKSKWLRVLQWAIFPVIAASVWAATILFLLISWIANGAPKYSQKQSSIVYISNVGAHWTFKPFFVAGTTITAVFFFISLVLDRRLRALSGVDQARRARDSLLSLLSIIFGFFSSIFLILLSVFDASQYQKLHWSFAGTAFASLIVSLFFNLLENRTIRSHHPTVKALRYSLIVKYSAFVAAAICIVLMFAFQAICLNYPEDQPLNASCDRTTSISAIFEWTLALMVAVYASSLSIDLSPPGFEVVAKQIEKETWRKEQEEEEVKEGQKSGGENARDDSGAASPGQKETV